MDWFNLGQKIAERWGNLRASFENQRGTHKTRYPNHISSGILQREFNASRTVIFTAIHRYLYEGGTPLS